MSTIYRAEKQTDPDKAPGQIVEPVGLYLRDLIQRIERSDEADNAQPLAQPCCPTGVGCPYAD